MRSFQVAVIAVLAALITLFFFSPRFVYFRALDIGIAAIRPEVNRANDTLRQLDAPLAGPKDNSNLVIRWRLFFPALGHFLRLPPWAFLTLPMVGCLLVLAFVAAALRGENWDFTTTLGGTVLAATCSWFFVSTGWLAYFDAWAVLCGLILSFGRQRWLLFAAAAIGPWIDERVILAMPLWLAVRLCFLALTAPNRIQREFIQDALWCAAGIAPWGMVRILALVQGWDPVSAAYFSNRADSVKHHHEPDYLGGFWQGFRWAWLPVAGMLTTPLLGSRLKRVGLGLFMVVTLAVEFKIADDLSRSVSWLLPCLLLGLIAVRRRPTRHFPAVLAICCGLNLVFPARHVIADWGIPIRYFYAEWDRWEQPPPEVDGMDLNARALGLVREKKLDEALAMFGWSVKLEPKRIEPLANRAVLLFQLGRVHEALRDLDAAVMMDPDNPSLLFNRARMRQASSDNAGALGDVRHALRVAKMDWPDRNAAAALELRLDLGTPAATPRYPAGIEAASEEEKVLFLLLAVGQRLVRGLGLHLGKLLLRAGGDG